MTTASVGRPDGRTAVRRSPQHTEPIARLRLRTGQELQVMNVSDSGALVEGTARLLPGTRIDVHVITRSGRVLTRVRIVRAHVSALAANRLVYRAALSFDAPVDTGSV